MSSRFKDKLKEIRDASQRRSEASHRARTDADLHRSAKTVQAFEFRERVESVIDDFVRNFQGEAPGFVLTRGFFEGKYMLALRSDEELLDGNGRLGRYLTRMMFLLDPHASDETFGAQCRKTVRNRDLETQGLKASMDDEGFEALSRFVETNFLGFAEAYFGETNLTRPASVPT